MTKKTVIYARCSTTRDQKPEVQLQELRNFCQARGWIVTEEIVDNGFSGTTASRPGLIKLMQLTRERQVDVVLVLKLDRLFRSLKNLILTLENFDELGIEFVSLKDNFDFTTSAGKLLRNLIASFAEFEASLIRERTLVGLDYARSKGKKLGRPKENDFNKILELRNQGLSYRQISSKLNCSLGAVCRAVRSASKTISETTKNSEVKTTSKILTNEASLSADLVPEEEHE